MQVHFDAPSLRSLLPHQRRKDCRTQSHGDAVADSADQIQAAASENVAAGLPDWPDPAHWIPAEHRSADPRGGWSRGLRSESEQVVSTESPSPMTRPDRDQILAASAGWVAVLLNVLPGLGAGYLYQRRWKAYWVTSILATAWFVAGAALGQDAPPEAESQNQLVGLIGLVLLAVVTATEAGLAVKRVRNAA